MSEEKLKETYRVGIIGTANRRPNLLKMMSQELYNKMIEKAYKIITIDLQLNLSDVVLVSGGAAWSDHVAIDLFNIYTPKSLELYLPCAYENRQFVDNGLRSWRNNPGYTANLYHKQFSFTLDRTSLNDINWACAQGANIYVKKGFHARNTEIAKVDYLIAFTWATDESNISGGSLDTWRKCKNQKIHVSLHDLRQTV